MRTRSDFFSSFAVRSAVAGIDDPGHAEFESAFARGWDHRSRLQLEEEGTK